MTSDEESNKQIPIDQNEKQLIDTARKEFNEVSNSLYKGGIDFVKWTSTISVAGIWYISTAINSSDQSKVNLLGFSAIFLALSVGAALFVVYFALSYLAAQTNSCVDILNFLYSKDANYRKHYSLPDIAPIIFMARVNEWERRMERFRNPSTFGLLIIIHEFFLLFGLSCFVFSMLV
jgi:hypothetical protein